MHLVSSGSGTVHIHSLFTGAVPIRLVVLTDSVAHPQPFGIRGLVSHLCQHSLMGQLGGETLYDWFSQKSSLLMTRTKKLFTVDSHVSPKNIMLCFALVKRSAIEGR